MVLFDPGPLPARQPKFGVLVRVPSEGLTHEFLTGLCGGEMTCLVDPAFTLFDGFASDSVPGGVIVKFRAVAPGLARWLPEVKEGETYETWDWLTFIEMKSSVERERMGR